MIFEKSSVVGENSGYAQRDGTIGSRQLILLVIGMVVSVIWGIVVYFILTGRPVENRVTWSLQPPRIVKTVARNAAPANLQAARVVQRGT